MHSGIIFCYPQLPASPHIYESYHGTKNGNPMDSSQNTIDKLCDIAENVTKIIPECTV